MTQRDGQAAVRYLTLVAGVVVVAVAGYTGFVLYPRFDLPSSVGIGLLGLAAASGIAAFFSPCSFPLLVTLLAGHATTTEHQTGGRPRPALYGAALALGGAVFMTILGAAIAAGGAAIFAGVTFTSTAGRVIRIAAGVLLVVLGLSQTEISSFSMHGISRFLQPRFGRRVGRRRPVRQLAVFGFGYVLAGFG